MTGKYIKLRALLPVLLLLTGCFKDRSGDCRATVSLEYIYELHDYSGDRFSQEVDHLHLYIYDGTGTLVQETDLPRTALADGNRVSLTLPGGSYTAITWGNIHTENFVCEGADHTSRMKLGVSCRDATGRLTTATPGSLFHGITNFEVIDGQTLRQVVPLTKNSNMIEVRIEGVDDPDAQIETVITGYNGHYAFDNTLHPDLPDIIYISDQQPAEGHIMENMQVYRLFPNDLNITLRVSSPDNPRYTYEWPLIPILLKEQESGDEPVLQEFLDRADTHLIYVRFLANGTVQASTVRSWDEVDNPTILD